MTNALSGWKEGRSAWTNMRTARICWSSFAVC